MDGSGRSAALHEALEHLGAGGLGERGQLGHRVLGVDGGALGPDADQDDPLEPELAVFDLGDVGELGGQAGDPAQRLAVDPVELVAVEVVGGVAVARIQGDRSSARSSSSIAAAVVTAASECE